jgi:hypothetical protein
MVINQFNQKNISNYYCHLLTNKIYRKLQVPNQLKRIFDTHKIKNRLLNVIVAEIWISTMHFMLNNKGKKKNVIKNFHSNFFFKKKFFIVNCKNFLLDINIYYSSILFINFIYQWIFGLVNILISFFTVTKIKGNNSFSIFYGIGHRDIINNNGKFIFNFLKKEFLYKKNLYLLVENKKKINSNIKNYLSKKKFFITNNIHFFFLRNIDISYKIKLKILYKHLNFFPLIIFLLKKKYRAYLLIKYLAQSEIISGLFSDKRIKNVVETMSNITQITPVVKKKFFLSKCIFYSCNHFTNQIISSKENYNYPEPMLRRFDHDNVIVWNKDEKNYLKKNNFFKKIKFQANKTLNWQPKSIKKNFNFNKNLIKVGLIFPLPISKKMYETNMGYINYSENYENISKFIEKIQDIFLNVVKNKKVKVKFYTKIKRNYNNASDIRFLDFLIKKKIKQYNYSKNFYEFFQEMNICFGFWKTSAGYLAKEVGTPFYYYSPEIHYMNIYRELRLTKKFGYCKSEDHLKKIVKKYVFLNH